MIRVQKWEEVEEIIKDCFSGDEDLLNKYHIKAGHGLDECVSDTINVLKNYTSFDFEFYKMEEEEPVGFIGIEPSLKYLTTFCVKKEYRGKVDLWKHILELMGDEFKCALYGKNTRAINFLLRNGCRVVKEGLYDNETIIILNYKKEDICR